MIHLYSIFVYSCVILALFWAVFNRILISQITLRTTDKKNPPTNLSFLNQN